LKTEALSEATLRGRFAPEDYPPGENFTKVAFENDQVRISRRACAPHKPCDLSPGPSTPGLLVAFTASRLRSAGAKESAFEPGQTEWLPAGATRAVENLTAAPAEVLLFEFKTQPLPERP
jgi:hypothetical protein